MIKMPSNPSKLSSNPGLMRGVSGKESTIKLTTILFLISRHQLHSPAYKKHFFLSVFVVNIFTTKPVHMTKPAFGTKAALQRRYQVFLS
jgi:hypothetical protein